MPSSAHFVLVHGASHGAWCWYKIRCLLECAGHKVTCPDLRAQGIDPTDPNTVFKFEDFNQPLDHVLSSLGEGEKVILVGHSAGGLNVRAAIGKYPEKLQAAVYLVGQMVRNVSSRPPECVTIDEEVYDVYYAKGADQPPTSCMYKKELIRHHYYNRSPLEDFTLASMLLRPVPIRALADANFPDNEEEIDKVPRVYIKTLDDKAISQEGQDVLIKNWPPSDVYTIDSDHSPFFSNPYELFGLLLKVATKYGGEKKSEEQPSLTAMNGCSNHGSLATKNQFHGTKCGRLRDMYYGGSNFLGLYHGCLSCGEFQSHIEEGDHQGKRYSKGSRHNSCDIVGARQRAYDDVSIDLKEQMTSMVNDGRQMKMKAKRMLLRNLDASRIVLVLCLGIFLVVVIVMTRKIEKIQWESAFLGKYFSFEALAM